MLDNNNSLVGFIEDRIGGQRSKFDVMATILSITQEPSLKNHIIGKGNFSDAMANHYLSILLYHNFLTSTKDKGGRTFYLTTEKGRKFIRHYAEIQNLFAPPSKQGVAGADSHEGAGPQVGVTGYASAAPKVEPSKKILVVDDETDIGTAMKIGLEDYGFKVDVYNDPVVALANYRPQEYDLLLFDVKMPGMSGFELFRRIKEVDDKANVCFLTAFEMYSEEFRKVFPSMDVRYFIRKPITMSDLVQQIQALTETK